jgi:uncharacterized membrane protein (DUF106 family)
MVMFPLNRVILIVFKLLLIHMFMGYKNNMEVVYNLIKNKYYHHVQMLPEYVWVSFRSLE